MLEIHFTLQELKLHSKIILFNILILGDGSVSCALYYSELYSQNYHGLYELYWRTCGEMLAKACRD